MTTENKVKISRPDYSPRDFEIGGAAASLYQMFAWSGQKVFAVLIGGRRASRSTLRNVRVAVGGALALGLASATIALIIAMIAVGVFHGSDDVIVGAPVGVGLLMTLVGFGTAWILIWYVERVRDEALRGVWLQDVGESESRSKMETSIDALAPIRRGRYYDEYFAARQRTQAPSEAHATAIRRCKQP